MNDHFIKHIEIKNSKCFEDFKAEAFGRVHLIGGKNNVGKTAFMEACFLGSVEKKTKKFIERSLIIELHRNSLNFLMEWINDFKKFKRKYEKALIEINKSIENKSLNFIVLSNDLKENFDFDNMLKTFFEKESPPLINNSKFISVGNNFNNYLVNFIDEIKLTNKEDDLNIILNELFDIEKIDIIKNKVMLKKDSKYLLLSEFGDGVKHFLNIILALYLNKNDILYLDEIENGIHYTNLDKLWEIILTISKQQNVQVFATTHSKECIESYARVPKRVEDQEIKYIKMSRLKDGKIMAGVRDYDMLQYTMSDGHEVRGV